MVRSISSRKELQLSGKANDHEGIEGKVEFTALTRIENNGGSLKQHQTAPCKSKKMPIALHYTYPSVPTS